MTVAPRIVAFCLVLILCFASVSLADDFKTVDGKEYKNATVSGVEPDGIMLRTKSGISKVYFVELPKEVQQRFHYEAAQAAQFTAATEAAVQSSNAEAVRQQQERKRALDQQVAAAAQQRQAQIQQEQIAAQQEQRRLEAQQKQGAKIGAQKHARDARYSSARRASHARAVQEDVNEHHRAAAEDIRYQISSIDAALNWNPLSKDQRQNLESQRRELEKNRDNQLNSIHY